MTQKIISSVFALALLTTTVGCPPPAQPSGEEVDISTEAVEVTPEVGDNTTGVTDVPSDNMTGVTEIPSDNMTAGSETP
ncbi:hypothetical protein [Allorhodopirellula solitaria]|uniref:Secreted protein n=1 Tax=Allorhodopirellula solitaria TaxID=2527987 RepID=A0A5C5YGX6_9BACT|nr:hypothetical protein [Allorhodopirellula solitaria]TWT74408.1 hypothetical protein CA85_12970 [Allorhodopirellula solitaria]